MPLSKREYEDFKGSVDKMVYKYATRDRSAIVSLISHYIDTGNDKRKLEDKLLEYVDKSTAYKLVDKTYMILDDLGLKVVSSKKRNHKEENNGKESKKPKLKEEILTAAPKANSATEKSSIPMNQEQQIKDMMAKAQAAIEQRKKQLAITGQSLTTSNGAGIGSMNATDVSSKIQKLTARIQATLGNSVLPPGLVIPTLSSSAVAAAAAASAAQAKAPETNEEQSKPTPLILDSEGRTVDLSGKEIQLTLRTPTLKNDGFASIVSPIFNL